MSKKTLLFISVGLVGIWALVATAIAAYLFFADEKQPSRPAEVGKVNAPIVNPSDQGGIVDDIPVNIPIPDAGTVPAEEAEPESEESDEPLPPVVVRPKSSQGLSRIDFNPRIGDIYQIHHDYLTDTLFMATIEPDGLKSVWRLDRENNLERVLQGNRQPGETFLEADSKGVLYAGFSNPGEMYRSDDLGENWVRVIDEIDGAFWSMADDGSGTLWGALHAYNKALLYRSTNDGRSWSVFKDFHEVFPQYAAPYSANDDRYALRHLHEVAYYQGKLFVGVGDVTRFTVMSEDGGKTWQEVWSEGFTAHVPLADGSGVLLGPDRLQSHGIALYNFSTGITTEVWSPIPYGYSGYTYSMMQMNGVYYAAFHTEATEVEHFSGKSGIIVSPNGFDWYPFLEFDPLTNWARTDIYMAPGKFLEGYVTLNGALYKFEPPIGRWFDVHNKFE